MIFPVIELFKSIQGEGVFTGHPSIFVRVTGCNLRCVFNGSECDTPYTSHRPEKARYSFDDTVEFIRENCSIRHIVITGGEPLLYMEGLNLLVDMIGRVYAESGNAKPVVTVETNGTLPIDFDCYGHLRNISLWSISPKLESSEPHEWDGVSAEWVKRHRDTRYDRKIFTGNIRSLLVNGNTAVQLKFVYTGRECVDEIKRNYLSLAEEIAGELYGNSLPLAERITVMLMPEGTSPVDIAAKRDEMIEYCISEGWVYCTRLHISLFGNERGK